MLSWLVLASFFAFPCHASPARVKRCRRSLCAYNSIPGAIFRAQKAIKGYDPEWIHASKSRPCAIKVRFSCFFAAYTSALYILTPIFLSSGYLCISMILIPICIPNSEVYILLLLLCCIPRVLYRASHAHCDSTPAPTVTAARSAFNRQH